MLKEKYSIHHRIESEIGKAQSGDWVRTWINYIGVI